MPRTKEAFEAIRETTRQRIEAAALSLFSRKGISVTIGEIAQTAGLSKGLLYSHYISKDALIATLVRKATVSSSQKIIGISQNDSTAATKIRQITSMMCEMVSELPIGIEYFMFMIQVRMSGFQVPEGDGSVQVLPDPIESLASIIEQGQAQGSVVKGDAMQLSTVYWATIQGLCCYALTGIPVTADLQIVNRILLKEEVC